MVERLRGFRRQFVTDDGARVALACYLSALGSPGGLVGAMRSSRGGHSLEKLGLGTDVKFCSEIDTLPTVPRFDPTSGRLTRVA